MKTLIVVDCETDGGAPGLYSMVNFGAVVVNPSYESFYGETKPISEKWIPEALAISGFTREQHLEFPDPIVTMKNFADWLNNFPNPILISDNNLKKFL